MTEDLSPQIVEINPAPVAPNPTSGEVPMPQDQEVEASNGGSENPDAEKKPSTIDQAIEKAMKKSRDAEEQKAKAKEPKEPEAAEKVEPKPEKARAADGKLQPKGQGGDAAEAPKPEAAQPRPTAFREAPQRFDDAAKREWEGVPESVRGAIHRTHRELEQGIEKYRGSHEKMEELREYDELAQKSGTTIKGALDRYVAADRMLRQNPIAALEQIVGGLGLRDAQGNTVTFRALAMAYAGQKPDQVAAQQDRNAVAMRNELQQLRQELAQIKQSSQQQAQIQAEAKMLDVWEGFKRDNPGADALEAEIAEILKEYPGNGKKTAQQRLADAFAIARARNPDAAHTGTPLPAQAQTLPQTTREPNPDGRKSIAGAPSSGTTPGGKKKAPPSIDDALASAIRRAS